MLIKLVSIHPNSSSQSIPLASAFLKAYALESNLSIDLVDFFCGDNAQICSAKTAESLPVAIGFSIYLWNRELCFEIAIELRKNHPDILLFCGGPEVTADHESASNIKNFDFLIIGEGELSFLLLCQALLSGIDYSTIPGLITPGSSKFSPPKPLVNLDLIPSPYLTGVIDIKSYSGILWQLSRGCSFSCDFCYDSRGIHGVRHFSLERVEAELRHFVTSSVGQVFVLDSTFNQNQDRAKQILGMIKNIAPDIHFHFEVRSEFIDREMADLFAQITCSLQIGLQSADGKVLKMVGRSFSKQDFAAKIGLLNKSGAVFGFDLIYGLPGDTLAGFCGSLDYALSLYPNHLDIFPLAVLPGTRLSSNGNKLNLRWDRHPPYILKSSNSFNEADITQASELADACDIFYTRGKSVAWFNSIIKFLGLKPSVFFLKFSHWLQIYKGNNTSKEIDFSDEEILKVQQLYLKELFGAPKHKQCIPLILDLVNYHHNYASALLSPLPDRDSKRILTTTLRNIRFKLAPSTRIVFFNYNIEEIIEFGEPNIKWMLENLSPSPSHAVIFNNGKSICTESFDASYIDLLEQIRDCGGKVDLALSDLNDIEADDFLCFALHEKIISLLQVEE